MDPRQSRAQLQKVVLQWDDLVSDSRDAFSYRLLLEELLFHSDLRFNDYVQFQESEGPFPVRLKRWIDNLPKPRDKQLLFRCLRHLIFIDQLQMRSLYRDAYRRVITRWLQTGFTAQQLLDSSYPTLIANKLRRYRLFSITESFGFSEFLHVNNLVGLEKPIILGDNPARARSLIPGHNTDVDGLIIFEDIVGTGSQAIRVLDEVRRHGAAHWNSLFVPMITLEQGSTLAKKKLAHPNFDVVPVFVVRDSYCVRSKPSPDEPHDFKRLRTLVGDTFGRVRERLNASDVPPNNPFGYKGCGCLLVTCHNSPNNSLPLIHHKAPEWAPLFRRLHHRTS